MRVFEFNQFEDFILKKIKSMPKEGRGELQKLAAHVGVHTSTLSQIMRNQKCFTMDQAVLVADYFLLGELETEYFLVLVEKSRASTPRLKQVLEKRRLKLLKEGSQLVNVLPQDRTLSEADRGIFYSNWMYSGIRVLSSINGFQTIEELSSHIRVPKRAIAKMMEFLIKAGLCIEDKAGFHPGVKYTHLESDSPHVVRHHANWRLRVLERHPHLETDELSYTSPMSLSAKDAQIVREKMLEFIKEINAIRDPSPCEVGYCLNMDWFRF